MLEISSDTILEKRQEDMSFHQQNGGHSSDKSVQEIHVIKEAKKIETNKRDEGANKRDEGANKRLAIFLHRKGLSENLIKTLLINTTLTDEHVRLWRTLNFNDDEIENLQHLWQTKLEVSKRNDSINSTFDDSCLSQDSLYLKEVLSEPLIEALREIVAKKPADPVEYLGHWLLHFKACEERDKRRKEEELELLLNREKLRIKEVEEKEFVPIEREDEDEPDEDWNYRDYGEFVN